MKDYQRGNKMKRKDRFEEIIKAKRNVEYYTQLIKKARKKLEEANQELKYLEEEYRGEENGGLD